MGLCIAILQDSECLKLGLIILNDFYGSLMGLLK
jgi:hypothetical protein